MATVGQILTAPESGWRRYDDTDSRLQFTGIWTSATDLTGYYNTYRHFTSEINACVSFKFYGTKIRLVGEKSSGNSTNVNITIDGQIYNINNYAATQIRQCLMFEKLGLPLGVHTITMTNLEASKYMVLDAIDIDSDGYLIHPILPQKSTLDNIQVGDVIPCRYIVPTSGSTGVFVNMGSVADDYIPVISSATPNGLFNWIFSGYDVRGRMKFIADRVIQHSISFDALNKAGIANGEGIEIPYDISLPLVAAWKMNEIHGNNAVNLVSSATATYTGTTVGTDGTISYRYFDGVDDCVVYNAKVIPVGKKTIRFKIKRNGIPGLNKWDFILSNQSYSPRTGFCMYVSPDGTIRASYHNNDTSLEALNSGINICDNKWHDVLFVQDTAGICFYIDDFSTPCATSRLPETEVIGNANYVLGRQGTYGSGGTGTWLKGYLTIPEIYGDVIDPLSFNEPSLRTLTGGTVYDVADRYNGTVTGTQIVDTPTGKGRYFDGKSQVTFNQKAIVPMGKKSIQIKFKKNSIPTVHERFFNQRYSVGSTLYGEFSIGFNPNTTDIYASFFGGSAKPNYQVISSGINLCDGNWHDVLFTWDGTFGDDKLTLIVDGTTFKGDVQTEYNHYSDTGGSIVIGNNSDFARYLTDSIIDSLEIYSDVIDPTKPLTSKQYAYSTRLLTGGTSATDKDNEWDKIIVESNLNNTITAGDNYIWNWNGMATFTSTRSTVSNTSCVRRGSTTVSNYANNSSVVTSIVGTTGGFRPVLLVEQLITTRYLIRRESDLYSVLNSVFTKVGTLPLSSDSFLSSGFQSIAELEPIRSSLNSSDTILAYSNNVEYLNENIYNYEIYYAIVLDGNYFVYDGQWTQIQLSDIYKFGMTSEFVNSISLLSYKLLPITNNSTIQLCGVIYTSTEDATPEIFNMDVTFNDYYQTGVSYISTFKNSYNTVDWKTISGVTITQDSPNGTDIRYAFSNDGQNNWFIYSDEWVPISKNDIHLYGMNFSQVTNLNSVAWKGLLSNTLDIYATLITNDVSVTPKIDSIKFNYEPFDEVVSSTSINIPVPEKGYRNILADEVNSIYTLSLSEGISFDDASVDYNFYTTPDKIKIRPLNMGTMIGGRDQNVFTIEVINSFDNKNFLITLRGMTTDGIVAEEKIGYGLLRDSTDESGRSKIELSTTGSPFTPQYPLQFQLNAGQKQLVFLRITPTIYSTIGNKQVQLKLTGKFL
jgi:hypothetical protein